MTVCICTCMCVYAQVHTAISSLYPTVPNRYMMRYSSRHWPEYSSRHWLDSLVDMQSSKSADVHARTFDTLRRYSLTEVGKERQTKHTGVTIHYFHTSMCLLTSTTRIAHKSPHSARQHVLLTRSGVSIHVAKRKIQCMQILVVCTQLRLYSKSNLTDLLRRFHEEVWLEEGTKSSWSGWNLKK